MSNQKHTVIKFGGSSLGTPENLAKVIDEIRVQNERGPIAVVVSAMGQTTDLLLGALEAAAGGDQRNADKVVDRVGDLAASCGSRLLNRLLGESERRGETSRLTSEIGEFLDPLRRLLYGAGLLGESSGQTRDLVLSFGERLSGRVVAHLMRAVGMPGLYVDARTWMVTDSHFGGANVDWPATQGNISQAASSWNGHIPVTTGFIGRSPDKKTTTLGRNGSDYTATMLARGLNAREVIVYTDVPGVMTADPAIVKDAYSIPNLSYMEALELANFGSRMFHSKTMIPLIEAEIPLQIRSTSNSDQLGTTIDRDGALDDNQPTSITSLENQALIDVSWRSLNQQARLGAKVLEALDKAGVTVWLATEAAHGQAISAVVSQRELSVAKQAIETAFGRALDTGEVAPIKTRAPVTLLTLVAEAMGRTPNVAGRLFQTLGGLGVMVRAIGQGASARSISCVVDADDTAIAVRSAHAAFNLAHQEVNLLLFGNGVVGSELIQQIETHREMVEENHGVRVKIAGLITSQKALMRTNGIDLDNLAEDWSDAMDIDDQGRTEMLHRLKKLPVPIMVDCTTAEHMEEIYSSALELGVHVVAANKKPLTERQDIYYQLMETVRADYRAYHYETTVGAGLPVIDTLKNLVRTGDQVLRIEGSFSGSLGYITGKIQDGTPLSQAVADAKENGFTEPAPQDDLSGLDVARKALILARELGCECELSDIQIEPYVPSVLLQETAPQRFFAGLAQQDDAFATKFRQAQQRGKVLAYLASIVPAEDNKGLVRVGLTEVDAEHPAARLKGAESFVAFYTQRYGETPLVVQGAGAGAQVTAAGVLADILKISQSLRGR